MSPKEVNEEQAAEAPKRTRAKKADAALAAEEPKKTRARKTKAAEEAPAAEVPAAEKPKRGRKKAVEASAEPEVVEADATAEKPKRGRKKKADAEGAPAEAAPVAEAPAAQATEKPKRGRKKKADAADAAALAAEADAAPAAETEAPKTSRRPGRSTKLRATIEAGEAAAAENATAEPQADSKAEGEAEEGTRRRRVRKSVQIDAEGAKEESAEGREARQQRKRERDNNSNNSNNSGRNDRGDRNNRNNRNNRNRQDRRNNRREPMVPKTSMEELAAMKVADLRAKAAELELDVTGLKKAELVQKVFEAAVRAEGFIEVEGILDIMQDGYGFLRTKGYLHSEHDVYVGTSTIRRNNLRKGDLVKGQTRPTRENEKFAALQSVASVNGIAPEELGRRVKFSDLTPIFPDEPLIMEHGRSTITGRIIDLVSPIGKGQRGLIVSPPKAGKTTVLKDIAASITANNPKVHLMCLLVDERPEEVTDMQRSIAGEVIASTFDMPTEDHIQVSELVIERAKRLVEMGEDVVILLDSLTRLARAYNLATPASGRILSGGVDSTALYPPKRFLGAARNIEGGGSLTILASALIETGSKMDEVIFEEFKGTGNMELKLDRQLADRRVFPAIDPVASGTRREDLLLNQQEAPIIWGVRRILSNLNNTERAMDMLIKSLKQTDTNQEFLMRTAKKAQTSSTVREVSSLM